MATDQVEPRGRDHHKSHRNWKHKISNDVNSMEDGFSGTASNRHGGSPAAGILLLQLYSQKQT